MGSGILQQASAHEPVNLIAQGVLLLSKACLKALQKLEVYMLQLFITQWLMHRLTVAECGAGLDWHNAISKCP